MVDQATPGNPLVDLVLLAWSQVGKILLALLAGYAGLRFLAYLDFRAGFKFSLAKLTMPQALYLAARFWTVGQVCARIIGAGLVLLVLVGPAEAQRWPTKYDEQIEAAARTYMPGVPWKLYKAQLWQESRLDPGARSPVGAEGLAQFMPATWSEVAGSMGMAKLARTDPAASITLGAVYTARLRRQLAAERPWRDRHQLALASYNAGLGHVLAAQRACTRLVPPDFRPWVPALYHDIMVCLPQITGRHAKETLAYAPAIFRHWAMMEGGA